MDDDNPFGKAAPADDNPFGKSAAPVLAGNAGAFGPESALIGGLWNMGKEAFTPKPGQEYSAILPLAKDKDTGKIRVAPDQLMIDAARAIQAPGKAARGQLNDQQMQDEARNMAGFMVAPKALDAAGAAPMAAAEPDLHKQAVQYLMDRGVTPKPGQILGGTAHQIEDVLSSTPITGDAMDFAQRAAMKEYNTALYKEALRPLGNDVADNFNVKPGRQAITAVKSIAGKALDDSVGQMTVNKNADMALWDGLNNIDDITNSLPENYRGIFKSHIKTALLDPMKSTNGILSGRTLQTAERQLRALRDRYGRSQDPGMSDIMSPAIGQVYDILDEAMTRQNPQLAEDYTKAKMAYANYARIRKAAAKAGVMKTHGIITPAQLANAVVASDQSIGGGALAEGKALLQPLAEAGQQVLTSTYPNSGTFKRAAWGGGLLGGGHFIPGGTVALGGLAAGAVPYLPGVRQGVAKALTADYGPFKNAASRATLAMQRPLTVLTADDQLPWEQK